MLCIEFTTQNGQNMFVNSLLIAIIKAYVRLFQICLNILFSF